MDSDEFWGYDEDRAEASEPAQEEIPDEKNEPNKASTQPKGNASEDFKPTEKTNQKATPKDSEGDSVRVSKEDAEFIARAREREIREAAIAEVSAKYSDFDTNKVFNALNDIAKKSPNEAVRYCSAEGLELLHLRIKGEETAKNSDNKVDIGRGAEPFDADKTAKAINDGTADVGDYHDFYSELGKLAVHAS